MKTTGYILIFIGGFSIFGCLIAFARNPDYFADGGLQQLIFEIGLLGLGIFLLDQSKKKQMKQKEKEKWNNN